MGGMPGCQETHHAHRGLILRRFSAHVGGQVRGWEMSSTLVQVKETFSRSFGSFSDSDSGGSQWILHMNHQKLSHCSVT